MRFGIRRPWRCSAVHCLSFRWGVSSGSWSHKAYSTARKPARYARCSFEILSWQRSAVFPGKVFEFAEMETAMILGRRHSEGFDPTSHRVRLRSVGEHGLPRVQRELLCGRRPVGPAVSLPTEPATMRSLYQHLDEVVDIILDSNPRISDVATVGRGIEFKGKEVTGRNPRCLTAPKATRLSCWLCWDGPERLRKYSPLHLFAVLQPKHESDREPPTRNGYGQTSSSRQSEPCRKESMAAQGSARS